MIFFLFMLLDLFTAIVLLLAQQDLVSPIVLLYHGGYLIVKGGWYYQSWSSWVDIIIGGWLIIMMTGVTGFFSYLAVAYICIKVGSIFFKLNYSNRFYTQKTQ